MIELATTIVGLHTGGGAEILTISRGAVSLRCWSFSVDDRGLTLTTRGCHDM